MQKVFNVGAQLHRFIDCNLYKLKSSINKLYCSEWSNSDIYIEICDNFKKGVIWENLSIT